MQAGFYVSAVKKADVQTEFAGYFYQQNDLSRKRVVSGKVVLIGNCEGVGFVKRYKVGIIYGILFIAACILFPVTRGLSLSAFAVGIILYILIDLVIYFFNRDHKIQWLFHFIFILLVSVVQ
jgi:uncharacterized membrane protein